MATRMETAADGELEDALLATGQGDRQAFSRLYQLTSPRLYAIALRMLSNRTLADDVLQEAFVLIWRKAGQFQPARGTASAWTTTILRNCAIDRLRAEKRGPGNTIEWNETVEHLMLGAEENPTHDSDVSAALATCLSRLQENQRKAIVMAYLYGMTHEELAEHLDSPLGTVKSWVRRGMLQLRDCLEE